MDEPAEKPAEHAPKPVAKKDEVVENFEVVDDDKPASPKARNDDNERDRKTKSDDKDRDRKKKLDDEDRPRARRSRDDDDDDRDRKIRRDDDDDRPRSRRSRDDDEDDRDRKIRRDDDDDDRSRSKRSRDDDDDDDRSRAKRSRDDDDDDRPRAKRSRDDDDDDRPRSKRSRDDDDRPRAKKRGRDDEKSRNRAARAQWEWAQKGLSFVNYGFFCQIGSFGALILFFLLAWMGGDEPVIMALACVPGLVGWILAGIGIGFIVAGPRRGNLLGLSIALASVAAVHLGLVLYAAFGDPSGLGRFLGRSSVDWIVLPTTFISAAASVLARSIGGISLSTLIVFAALFEIARFVLLTVYLKELGKVCKEREATNRCTMLLIALPSAFVGAVIVLLLGVELMKEAVPGRTFAQIIALLYIIAKLGAYALIYLITIKTANEISDAAYKMY